MRKRRRTAGLTVLIIAVLGIGGWLLYKYIQTLEYIEENIHVGYKGKAKAYSFLAAQRLLERFDFRVQMEGRFRTSDLMGEEEKGELVYYGLMISPLDTLPQTRNKVQKLDKWLESGGVLITGNREGYSFKSETVPKELLELLKIEKHTYEGRHNLAFSANVVSSGNTNSDSEFEDEPMTNVVRLNEYWNQRALRMELNHRVQFNSELEDEVRHRGQLYFANFEKGYGRVIYVNDLSIFENDPIERADHASFLIDIAELTRDGDGDPSGVLIFFLNNSIGFWSWLWQEAWLSLILLLLAFLSLAWFWMSKFGPTLPVLERQERRSLTEHLLASGKLYWSESHLNKIFLKLRQQAMQKVFKDKEEEDWDETIDLMSKDLALDPQYIRSVLKTNHIQKEEFISTIRCLQWMNKKK